MLKELAHQENLLFLALTETHLNEDHLDAEITIDKYTAFRTDRVNRCHGAVINYIREAVAASREKLMSYSNGTTELLILYLKRQNLLLITVYRPPNTTRVVPRNNRKNRGSTKGSPNTNNRSPNYGRL